MRKAERASLASKLQELAVVLLRAHQERARRDRHPAVRVLEPESRIVALAQRLGGLDPHLDGNRGRPRRVEDREHALQQLRVSRVGDRVLERREVARDRPEQSDAAGLVGQRRLRAQIAEHGGDEAVHLRPALPVQDAAEQQRHLAGGRPSPGRAP